MADRILSHVDDYRNVEYLRFEDGTQMRLDGGAGDDMAVNEGHFANDTITGLGQGTVSLATGTSFRRPSRRRLTGLPGCYQ